MHNIDEVQKFDFRDSTVRVRVDEQGEPWWVAKDVCECIGISKHRDALRRLQHDERGRVEVDTPGGPQEMAAVSEPGLYRLIFRSRKEKAKSFQRWVFHEVLPKLRRTGRYEMDNTVQADNDDQPAPPLAEREVRHPDGKVVIERYDVGHVTHRSISAASAGGPQRLDSDDESVEPDVPVDVLRRRFHGALSAALSDLDEYRRLHRNRRGEFKRRLNRQLKAFVGSPREEWSALDYANAVHWLRFEHSIDIRWILRSSTAGGGQ